MKVVIVFQLILLFMNSTAFGATWFVNNKTGNDGNDGQGDGKAFATFARTVKACKTSDKIVIANTGIPYRERLSLVNLGGTPAKPFIIEGNGAVLSGFRAIQASEWKKAGENLYFIELDMKWFYPSKSYFLCSDGKRIRRSTKASKAEGLKPGEWLPAKDGIYFKCDDGKTIDSCQITGVTLICALIMIRDSSYITCRNVVTEYSADDGIDGFGDSRGLYFENIESRNNGDQPVSFHDFSEATVRNCWFHHNGTGIVDVNASRTYYNGVLCEDNELTVGFNGGFHTMVDCVLRNNNGGVDIRALPITHLPGCEKSPIENTTVILKNVLITETNRRAKGIVLQMEGVKNQVVMEHCVIEGCQTAVWALLRKDPEDSFLHITSSAIINCENMILNDNPASKFRFHGDYNVYCPAGVNWLGKKYPPAELENFLKTNGSDQESKIGVLSVKENGRLVDAAGLLTGKLQSVGLTYFLNEDEIFRGTMNKNVIDNK